MLTIGKHAPGDSCVITQQLVEVLTHGQVAQPGPIRQSGCFEVALALSSSVNEARPYYVDLSTSSHGATKAQRYVKAI